MTQQKDLHPNIDFSNLNEYFREATWEEALDYAAKELGAKTVLSTEKQ